MPNQQERSTQTRRSTGSTFRVDRKEGSDVENLVMETSESVAREKLSRRSGEARKQLKPLKDKGEFVAVNYASIDELCEQVQVVLEKLHVFKHAETYAMYCRTDPDRARWPDKYLTELDEYLVDISIPKHSAPENPCLR